MPMEVLRMQFAHYLEEFADDEGFLQATYQAGLQVERMKALEKARETIRPTRQGEKEGKRKEALEWPKPMERPERQSPWGQPGRWASKEDALKGVPLQEHEKYFRSPESCWH